MINKKIFNSVVGAIFLISCSSRKQNCDIMSLKELTLYPVNAVLKLPPYKVVDTSIFDTQTILNYNIKTVDSSLNLIAFVYSYENEPAASFSLNDRMSFQKHEVVYGQDSIKPLIETFPQVGNTKVGYLKYLDEKRKRYEGRIFFFKDKKLVVLWLFEKYQNQSQDNFSLIDCILENIELH